MSINRKVLITKFIDGKIYSSSILKRIRSIIGSPNSYNKANNKKKTQIYNKLKELSLLKNYLELFNYEKNGYLTESYPDQFIIFSDILKNVLNSNIKRVDSSLMKNQLILSFKETISFLLKNGFIETEYDPSSFLDEIKIDIIFTILLDSAFSSFKYVFDDDNVKLSSIFSIEDNEIEQVVLFEKLLTKLILTISFVILDRNKISLHSGICFIHDNIELIKKSTSIKSFDKLTYQLIDIFEKIFECEIRQLLYTNSIGKQKSLKLIKIPSKFLSKFISTSHIPEILPIDVEFEKFYELILSSKKIKSGVSNLRLSKKTKEILKISQKKKYRINTKAIDLFNEIDELPYELVKNIDSLPFIPKSQFLYLIDQLEESEKLYTIIKNKEKKELNESEKEIYKEHHKLMNDMNKSLKLRKVFNTVLEMARLFEGFPIYFIESFDYRLRMYTVSDIFSRTTGIRKYLLSEFNEKKLTYDGIVILLKSFFHKYEVKYNELLSFISYNKNVDDIVEWGDKNVESIGIEEILNEEAYFYRLLLKKEIKNLKINNHKSSFMIEIDQKTSSLVIMSFVAGDVELAKFSNLIDVKDTVDSPSILMDRSEEFFKNKVKDISTLQILKKERNLHKRLQMFFIYNQKYGGRFRILKEYNINDDDLKIVCKYYEEFLDSVYKNLYKKRDRINEIIKFYIQKSGELPLEVKTLDESIISWYIFKSFTTKSEKKHLDSSKCLSPIDNSNISYRPRKKDVYHYDKERMVRSFLASFIHSIDGAIMRLIIHEVYEKSGYIISHLHDSIQTHPNNYNSVINAIKSIYSSDVFDNILEDKVLKILRGKLLDEDIVEFDSLINELKNDSFENIKVVYSEFDPEKMYLLE